MKAYITSAAALALMAITGCEPDESLVKWPWPEQIEKPPHETMVKVFESDTTVEYQGIATGRRRGCLVFRTSGPFCFDL